MRRLLAMGRREDVALAFLMGFCILSFIAQVPRLVRDSHLADDDFSLLIAGALMGSIIVLPFVLYLFAAMTHFVRKIFRKSGTGYGCRLALFWSLLATTPVVLMNGLVAGFLGDGVILKIVGFVWLIFFLWFWLSMLGVSAEERS